MLARCPTLAWLLVALLLAPLAAAQEEAPSEPWVVVVAAGEVFNRTSLRESGAGTVLVHGRLDVAGTPEAPARFQDVTFVLHGPGPHRLVHARLQHAGDAIIDHRGGELRLANVTLQGGAVGVRANGTSALVAEDVRLDDQRDAAIHLLDAASLALRRATLRGDADGIRAATAGAVEIADSALVLSGVQALLAPPPGLAWEGRIANTTFGAPPFETSRAGLVVEAAGEASLRLEGNRFRGAAIGLRVAGAGATVDGARDAFEANALGVRVEDPAVVRLASTLFANNTRDVRGQVVLIDPTHVRPPLDADAPASAPVPDGTTEGATTGAATSAAFRLSPWLVGGGLALLLAVAVAPLVFRRPFERLRAKRLDAGLREEARARIEGTLHGSTGLDAEDVARRAGLAPLLAEALLDEMADEGSVQVRRVGEDVPRYRLAPPAPQADAPAVDVGTPLRPQEARILRDMLDHPGTPQSAVAQRLGLSRQALHYHVKKLEARGLVTKVAKGRETHCYVRPEAAPLAAAPAEEEAPDAPVAPPGDTNRG